MAEGSATLAPKVIARFISDGSTNSLTRRCSNSTESVPSTASCVPSTGPDVADLRCVACGATWTGVITEPCPWCERSYQIMLDFQQEIALRAPEIDRADKRYNSTMNAWGERLAVAVKAGIVPEHLAVRVLKRSAA